MGMAPAAEDDATVDFVTAHAKAHGGASVRCALSPGRGRCLRATRDFEEGQVIFTELPLHIVRESPGNAAFDALCRLCQEHTLPQEPRWYWAALASLTAEQVGAESPLQECSARTQAQILMLYQGSVAVPGDAAKKVCESFALAPDVATIFESCLQAWIFNAFACCGEHVGSALYFLPSFMNHSCMPTSTWSYGPGHSFILKARRPIKAGDEVTISYLPEAVLLEPALARRHELWPSKRFWCDCERCSGALDRPRGLRCPGCSIGTVFARLAPAGPWPPAPARDAGCIDGVVQPLRPGPHSYDHDCAGNLALWLTLGAPSLKRSAGQFYYEVRLGRGMAEPQVGWATDAFQEAEAWTGAGVGDDADSWAADGMRHQRWHAGECLPASWPDTWLEDDVVGCAIDIDAGSMAFSRNGVWVAAASFAFAALGRSFYPAVSSQGEFAFHLGAASFRFSPPGGQYEPLLDSRSGDQRPLDRWSPLGGSFAGALCPACGGVVDLPGSLHLDVLERALLQGSGDGDGEEDPELSPSEASRAESLLAAAAFPQHAAAGRLHRRLARFYGSRRDWGAAARHLRRLCDFCESAYPGPSGAHASALEAYGDALVSSSAAGAADDEMAATRLELSRSQYVRALQIFTVLYGADEESAVSVEGKLRSLRVSLSTLAGDGPPAHQ